MSFFSKLRGEAFERGIHPPQHKETAGMAIRRLPFAPKLVVHLSQQVGRPARPIVKVGEEVVRGQPIAEADGFVSVPHHAPASGVVEAIRLYPNASGYWGPAIIIRVHRASSQEVLWEAPQDIASLDEDGLVKAVQATGIVGLGGGVFPTHAKLKVPKEWKVDTLVVNGCECEPYLTSDHRIMIESARDIMAGIGIARQLLGGARAIIGIEDNKADAADALRPYLPSDGGVSIQLVPTKYPQGAGEMLVKALLNREVPPDARSYTVGAYLQNVTTLSWMGALMPAGRGFIERVITVAGPGVKKPGNYLIPIGTPLKFLLEHVGVEEGALQVVFGGPMMGQAVASLKTPITKGVSGILVFRERDMEDRTNARVYPCIKCGACVSACPMGLNPSMLGMLAAKHRYDDMSDQYNLGACFECGSCAFECPSNIPLVQQFRVAKQVLRERASS